MTDKGVVPKGEGWWVMNARDARWRRRPGRGHSLPLSGSTDEECETIYSQLGVNLLVLGPGEPIGMYHWEADAEGFLVISGEPILLIEGQERPLRPWDYVHCPPKTEHIIVGAGEVPCVVLAMSSREFMASPEWGGYMVNEVALRHDVGVEEDTTDPEVAYARYPGNDLVRYEDGWLPDC